jgi:hypothetical protein
MSSALAERLSLQTRDLISRFEARADSFAGRTDITGLTVPLDARAAERFARDFFGDGEHIATGIDGSMDYDEQLQMMLFYSNATAYSCPFRVHGSITFDLNSARRDARLSASAAVPLWSEDVGSVFSEEPEIDIELEHSMQRIPNSFMTLGELFLATQACEKSRIILLDRPMSGTFATLSRDARILLRRRESRLTKWSSGRVSLLDIYLGVSLGAPQMPLPSRGRFLTSAIIRTLMDGPRKTSELATALHVTEEDVRKATKRILELDKRFSGTLLADRGKDSLSLNGDVPAYWSRLCSLALEYAEAAFGNARHPLALGGDEYLTILDVNTVSLFLLDLLYSRAMTKNVLVIGIAKDTTATDITRAVMPFAAASRFITLDSPPPRLKNDKAFLTILSSENGTVKTPWRTISYDSAYSTIVNTPGGFVSARKVVSRERLFARSFFQLRTLRSDAAVKSPVFLFDRIYDERFDRRAVRRFEVKERSDVAEIDAYFEGSARSDVSNAILHILSLSDNPEVFEAYGHNQLLYLADKAVKADVRMLRGSLRGVANLRVGGISRRRKIFGIITSYREQRAVAEEARSRGQRGR